MQRACVDTVDVSLIDRGAAVLWEGEGRYDRAWHNHLDLTIDKDSKVEMLAPMPITGADRAAATPEKILGSTTRDDL